MNKRILIVDDSALARRMLKQPLVELGFDVEEASDGASALERFALNPPDLVVLDMVMSGMYGLDVLEKMKELAPDVKVIVATADIQASTVEQVRAAGAKAMLTKPVNRQKLAAAVESVLSGGESWT